MLDGQNHLHTSTHNTNLYFYRPVSQSSQKKNFFFFFNTNNLIGEESGNFRTNAQIYHKNLLSFPNPHMSMKKKKLTKTKPHWVHCLSRVVKDSKSKKKISHSTPFTASTTPSSPKRKPSIKKDNKHKKREHSNPIL